MLGTRTKNQIDDLSFLQESSGIVISMTHRNGEDQQYRVNVTKKQESLVIGNFHFLLVARGVNFGASTLNTDIYVYTEDDKCTKFGDCSPKPRVRYLCFVKF